MTKTLAQDGQSLAIGSAPMQIPLGTSAPLLSDRN